MNNKIAEIIEKKKEDLRVQMQQVSLEQLREKVKNVSNNKSFKKNIEQAKGKTALIAEIKLASPSDATLNAKVNIGEQAKAYEQAGADAISFITEKHFFKGSTEALEQLEAQVRLPILQKDFVIDPYQIYEAKSVGSSAILLIARIVDAEKLQSLVKLTKEIGIESVVEIHSEEDLQKALVTTTEIIAVNARDLDTFTIDPLKAYSLLDAIPDTFIKLGFSGISGRPMVEKYAYHGAKGVLIGTSLMHTKLEDIKGFIRSLKGL